jgi:hypothetical protein
MHVMKLTLGLFAAVLSAAALIPTFSDFGTPESFQGPVVEPMLRNPDQRKFEAQIRRQSTLPANFAGHYKIAEWGCGSSCVSIAVINLKTGEVYEGPFSVLGYGNSYKYEGGYDELEYKATSRLLIARGCPGDKNCGTYYYEWKGNHFNQLRFEIHGPLL